MAVEVIDGTVEPSEPVGRKFKYGRFEQWRLTTASGETRIFRRIAAAEPVMGEAAQGGAGRFYIVKAEGAYGLVGLRRPDGREFYAHYSNVEVMVLVVGLLGTACAIGRFGLGIADLPLLASVLGPLLLLGWLYLRGQRRAGLRRFEADRTMRPATKIA